MFNGVNEFFRQTAINMKTGSVLFDILVRGKEGQHQ